MSVADLIRNRRTIYEFKEEPVTREVLGKILECAVWAPNHKLTEPWRFVVVTGATREKMAQIYARIQREKTRSSDPTILETAGQKGYAKFMSKPNILIAVCKKDTDAFRAREDYAATCCAIQNLTLAAWEQGVGMQWSTSALCHDPEVYDLLSIDAQTEEIIGVLYTGYPALIPEQKRVPASERTTWFE